MVISIQIKHPVSGSRPATESMSAFQYSNAGKGLLITGMENSG